MDRPRKGLDVSDNEFRAHVLVVCMALEGYVPFERWMRVFVPGIMVST
jgi:hypothetical protein